MKMRPLFTISLSIPLLITACAPSSSTPPPPQSTPRQSQQTPTPSTSTPPKTPKLYSAPPAMVIDTNKNYTAILETDKGKIVVELFTKDAPKTVNNFVFLSREGFYDGTTFHRVLPGFMAQGGDPTGTGTGGPGYRFADEFSQKTHETGVLSMANAGPNTNGSQFFITYVPTPHLNGKHSVFGKVTQGMDVLGKLRPRDPSQNPGSKGDTLIKVTIEEKP